MNYEDLELKPLRDAPISPSRWLYTRGWPLISYILFPDEVAEAIVALTDKVYNGEKRYCVLEAEQLELCAEKAVIAVVRHGRWMHTLLCSQDEYDRIHAHLYGGDDAP